MGISSLRYRFGVLLGLLVAFGCAKQNENEITVPVRAEEVKVDKPLGDGQLGYRVLGEAAFRRAINDREILPVSSTKAQATLKSLAEGTVREAVTPSADESSLVLGFPMDLLGESQIFGGVVTGVSDKQNETLGRLKLTDLTPIHVRPVLAADMSQNYYLVLKGCDGNCTEGSEEDNLLAIPVLGIDFTERQVLVNLASLAEPLNLIAILDPKGEYTKLKTKSAKTIAMDYSLSTLVFDIKVTMVPLDTTKTDEVDFTARWYLKLASHFDPSFISRSATDGVGYFMTERAAQPKIQRFPLSQAGEGGRRVKYFIKNVPVEFQKAFAGAFDEWNSKFRSLLGRDLLAYEFIATDDPRNELLVAGDPRFNILEWDLVNLAPYGGLGPSIANQYTGEILTANVLIQGPTIMKLYSTWFQASVRARELEIAGNTRAAAVVLKEATTEINRVLAKADQAQLSLNLGALPMRVTSQMPALQDPLFQREDFDDVPVGYTFQQYMDGYFHDMVAHELGHNLGLRHNFFGNLEATPGDAERGRVSSSIMEYLGRRFRYLDKIGFYDEMAIAYGYRGITPERRDLFCTDENVPDEDNLGNSAECSRDDATRDPFDYLERRLQRAVRLIVNRGSAEAPVWKVDDMKREVSSLIPAMGMYAATAEKTANTWKRFFTGGNRPNDPSGVRNYVQDRFNEALCGPEVESALSEKATEEARAMTRSNLASFTQKVVELLKPLKTYEASELGCTVPTSP